MDENVLSQDEIDALLSDVGGDDADADASSDIKAQGGSDPNEPKVTIQAEDEIIDNFDNKIIQGDDNLKALDFDHQERIIRGQFPVLERLYDRMIRNLTDELFLLFSREVEVEQEPFSIVKCREFMATLEPPLVINVYRFNPLRSKALILFNGAAIFEIVENYFGGHSSEEEEVKIDPERELTAAEVKTCQMVATIIEEKLEAAWETIVKLKTERIKTETSSQMLNIYAPADLLVITKFKCSFGNENSAFYIVMPYLMIDPIREQLELGAAQSDQEDDPNWVNALKNELLNVNLDVQSELATKKIKLSEVLNWQVGDFIPLEVEGTVPVSIENYPLFRAKVGTTNEKYSLQIVNKIEY